MIGKRRMHLRERAIASMRLSLKRNSDPQRNARGGMAARSQSGAVFAAHDRNWHVRRSIVSRIEAEVKSGEAE
jgi:hypothetical protein